MDKKLGEWLAHAFLFGGGGLTLFLGILARAGSWKAWFTTKRVPVLIPTSYYFGYIPGGLALLLAGLVLLVDYDTGSMLLFCGALPCLLLSIILAIWQPWWIKPAWYRWLEEQHSSIIPILQKEARAMGRRKWQRRVSTQEGLEEWVEEVRRKYGLNH